MREKYIYYLSNNPKEKAMIQTMKIMVINLTNGVKLDELYAAENVNGEKGIFCSTELGGQKFWTYNELLNLFVQKNGESKRLRH